MLSSELNRPSSPPLTSFDPKLLTPTKLRGPPLREPIKTPKLSPPSTTASSSSSSSSSQLPTQDSRPAWNGDTQVPVLRKSSSTSHLRSPSTPRPTTSREVNQMRGKSPIGVVGAFSGHEGVCVPSKSGFTDAGRRTLFVKSPSMNVLNGGGSGSTHVFAQPERKEFDKPAQRNPESMETELRRQLEAERQRRCKVENEMMQLKTVTNKKIRSLEQQLQMALSMLTDTQRRLIAGGGRNELSEMVDELNLG